MIPQIENIRSLKNRYDRWTNPKCRTRPQQVTSTPLSISDKLRLQKPRGHRPIGVSLPPTWTPAPSLWQLYQLATSCCSLVRKRSEVTHFWMTPSKTAQHAEILKPAIICQCILNKALNPSVTAHYRLVLFLV